MPGPILSVPSSRWRDDPATAAATVTPLRLELVAGKWRANTSAGATADGVIVRDAVTGRLKIATIDEPADPVLEPKRLAVRDDRLFAY